MTEFMIGSIGTVQTREGMTVLALDREMRPALAGLEGFSHIIILWWADGCADEASRAIREEVTPYRQGPERLGTFATRSPRRPNPIAISCAQVIAVDAVACEITVAYMDARPGTHILDVKPYTPSLDRVEAPRVPAWCAHWPKNIEESGMFDWSTVFGGEEA